MFRDRYRGASAPRYRRLAAPALESFANESSLDDLEGRRTRLLGPRGAVGPPDDGPRASQPIAPSRTS